MCAGADAALPATGWFSPAFAADPVSRHAGQTAKTAIGIAVAKTQTAAASALALYGPELDPTRFAVAPAIAAPTAPPVCRAAMRVDPPTARSSRAGPPMIRRLIRLTETPKLIPMRQTVSGRPAARRSAQPDFGRMSAGYRQRRDRMLEMIGEAPGMRAIVPDGAFYLYVSVAALIGCTTPNGHVSKSDVDVTLYLLDEARVAVLDGSSYGCSPYLRLSFATSLDAIEEGCRRIKRACEVIIDACGSAAA